jgi:2-C-methyl-D-erythritol 4-phosphate cytidylyltransferase
MSLGEPQQPVPDKPVAGVVIVAAGAARRMGFDKMFAQIDGIPVLGYTVPVFQSSPEVGEIVLVMHANNIEAGRRLVKAKAWAKVTSLCLGGELRQDSVAAGLAVLGDWPWIVIQDGARPLVSGEMITRGLAAAADTGAAIAAVPMRDTVKLVKDSDIIEQTLDRSQLWSAQTPQVFRQDLIRQAYRSLPEEVTDDAILLEQNGISVKVYFGGYDNIKVTSPEDLDIVRLLLQRRRGQCGPA